METPGPSWVEVSSISTTASHATHGSSRTSWAPCPHRTAYSLSWSYRCSGCWLLPISWVSRLSVICRISCIGGPGGSYHNSDGIISTSAILLDKLTVCLGGIWTSITCGRLSIRSCIGCLPIGRHRLSLGIADASGLSIGSITSLCICLGGSVNIFEWSGWCKHCSPASL